MTRPARHTATPSPTRRAHGVRSMTPMATIVRLARACDESRGALLTALTAVVALGLAQLYLTWLIKEWVEGPLVTGDRSVLLGLGARVTATLAVAALALFCSRYLIVLANQRLVERLRNQAVERLFAMEASEARRFARGDLLARLLNDANELSTLIATLLRRAVREAIVYVGSCVMMLVLNWRLTLAAALLVPVLVLLMTRLGRRIRQWRARAQADVGAMGATLSEQLHGLTTIKGYRTEEFETARFADRTATVRRQLLRSEAWFGGLASAIFVVTGMGMLAVLSYATVLRGDGSNYGSLLAFCLYGAQLIQPLRQLGDVQGLAQQAIVSADRIFEVTDRPPAPDGDRSFTTPVRGRVVFDRVSFAYRPGEPVLRDFSMSIEPNELVGLVGATGSGKSTIAGLLLRHVHPSQGGITVDDVPVAELRASELRAAVSVVEQDPFLFSGPVRENIRYGSWDASTDAIERAVHLSGLDGLEARLPSGLDTDLAEAGTQLSGGERQRIALARAIVRGAPILVLDESTSAIDSELEAEMFARMAPWLAERTVIIIGHRLATVRRCRRIIVLKGGLVVGDGPFAHLAATNPTFEALFADQMDPVPSGQGLA